MLWEKIHRNPKIGDTNHKDNKVVNMQFVAGVAVTVIMCIALLILGGVSQVAGKTLYEPEFGKRVYEPEFGERIYEPEFGERVYEPAFGKRIYEPAFGKRVYEPRFAGPPINVAYLRCAKLKEFNEQLKCANEAIGITEEEISASYWAIGIPRHTHFSHLYYYNNPEPWFLYGKGKEFRQMGLIPQEEIK